MNKKASVALIVLGIIALIALVGLVWLFVGRGQPTGQVLKVPKTDLPSITCSDSDDGNVPGLRGFIKQKKGATILKSATDDCSSAEQLMEYYCSGQRIDRSIVKCEHGCASGTCKAAPSPAPVCGNNLVEQGEQCEPPSTERCDAKCQKIIAPAPAPAPTPAPQNTTSA